MVKVMCLCMHVCPYTGEFLGVPFSWLSWVFPGEKDHANTRLVRALVGTTRISADICEILIVQRPITPKRAGASGSRINNDGVSTLKQACSGR